MAATAASRQMTQKCAVPMECWMTQKGGWRPQQSMHSPLYSRAKAKYARKEAMMLNQWIMV